MAQRNPAARAPRLMPLPVVLGAEADAFAPTTLAEDEQLASLVYISGAQAGLGDTNARVSSFVAGLSNSVYSEYMNSAYQR